MKRPLTGKNAAVFVGVGITQHHLEVASIQAADRKRVGKKFLNDAGRMLKVVDRFKQWNHRQWAGQTIGTHLHKPRLAGEQIHGKKIGGAARHRDNQGTEPGITTTRTVLDQHAVAIEHCIGFGTGGDA